MQRDLMQKLMFCCCSNAKPAAVNGLETPSNASFFCLPSIPGFVSKAYK